jgi:hypothetical protein
MGCPPDGLRMLLGIGWYVLSVCSVLHVYILLIFNPGRGEHRVETNCLRTDIPDMEYRTNRLPWASATPTTSSDRIGVDGFPGSARSAHHLIPHHPNYLLTKGQSALYMSHNIRACLTPGIKRIREVGCNSQRSIHPDAQDKRIPII